MLEENLSSEDIEMDLLIFFENPKKGEINKDYKKEQHLYFPHPINYKPANVDYFLIFRRIEKINNMKS